MGDWPGSFGQGALPPYHVGVAHPDSLNIFRSQMATMNTAAWSVAGQAVFVPFRVNAPTRATKILCVCGSSAGGNIDMGIYDARANRLWSSGAIVRAPSSTMVANIAGGLPLKPGIYYMALVVETTGAMFQSLASGPGAAVWRLCGVRSAIASYPLPAAASWGPTQTPYLPALTVIFDPTVT